MWWDWTQITVWDSMLFSILSLIVLCFIGSGILRLISCISKKVDVFKNFDFIQKANVGVLFGFIFVFVFSLMFSVFNLSYLFSGLFAVALAGFGFVLKRPRFKLDLPRIGDYKSYVLPVVVFVVILLTMYLSSNLISGFYGSTNDDAAFHTLVVRVLLDNPNALISRVSLPNSFYPSAPHVLGAFQVALLGVEIQKSVIMLSAVFPALIALAFYSTTKSLFRNQSLAVICLIMAALFTVTSSFGPIYWGGIPLYLSLYLSINILGLFYSLLLGEKFSWFIALLLGLIFFIAAQTYPDALVLAPIWLIFLLGKKLFGRDSFGLKSGFVSKRNVLILVAFLVPLLLSVPFLHYVLTNLVIGEQLGELSPGMAAIADSVKVRIGFNWLFNIQSFSSFFFEFGLPLVLAPYSLILLLLLFMPLVSKRVTVAFPFLREFRVSLFLVYLLLVVVMGYLAVTLFLPINQMINLLNPRRILQHIFVPGTILSAVVLFSFFSLLTVGVSRLLNVSKLNFVGMSKNKVFCGVLSVVLIFSLGVPLLERSQIDYGWVRDSSNIFESIGRDDILLMRWIRDNLPSNVTILTSAADSGQYVTSVTNRTSVSLFNPLLEYGALMWFMTSNASDLRAVPLLIKDNITHIYIGSAGSTYALNDPIYREFNASQFSAAHFTLIMQVGDSWLFEFDSTKDTAHI